MSVQMPDDLPAAGGDVRTRVDEMRPLHGMIRNARGEWELLRHGLVVQAALSDELFSNAVSSHRQIPNGLDSAEHTAYRYALDRFLTPEAIAPFHERFRQIASGLIASLPRNDSVDAVSQIGTRFAVRAQSTWLGWPASLEARLVDWVAENQAATRSGDKARIQRIADAFDDIIRSVLEPRRTAPATGTDDITSQLMRTRVNGQLLTDAEIVSILRNWTGGDLGSIALCLGVLIHYLATHPAEQDRLRTGVSDPELDAIINEALRIDDPFVSNRRVTKCPVTLEGIELPQGTRIKLNWTSANRDETLFGDPDVMAPDRHAAHNLVYGIGKHICPGRWLSTLEMRTVIQELLAATASVTLDPHQAAERAAAPVGGWARVPVVLA